MLKLLEKNSQFTKCYALTLQPKCFETIIKSMGNELEAFADILSPSIAEVLPKFFKIFHEPKILHPHRIFDHKILLKNGA